MTCVDCPTELTADTRSEHQPGVRCLDCFDSFRESVSVGLASWWVCEEDTLAQACAPHRMAAPGSVPAGQEVSG